MKFNDHSKNNTRNSYFLIDKINKIINFNIDHFKSLEKILLKKPEIGQTIGEIIPHKYLNYFTRTINDCFDGNSITIERKVKFNTDTSTQLQLVFTPINIAGLTEYIVCTIINKCIMAKRLFEVLITDVNIQRISVNPGRL